MNEKYATIIGPGRLLSQGILVKTHQNGQATIRIFDKLLTGFLVDYKR
jgi:hypothetical protein